MDGYRYIARGLTGNRKQGIKEALCVNDVLCWLRDQGFTPVSVEQITAGVKKSRLLPRIKSVRTTELAAFCWQLSIMIKGGVTITSALEVIARDMQNPSFKNILLGVLDDIQGGESFSKSISKFPKVFNNLFCAMILAGETGGTLPEALQRLAQYLDNRDKLIKRVKGALAYPVFVLVFIVLIVAFMMTVIVPKFVDMFDQFGGKLPAFTQGFLNFYNMLRYNFIYIAGLILLLTVSAFYVFTKTRKGHYLFCRIALGFPLLGKLLRQTFIAVFCRTMATLVISGVSVLEIFDIMGGLTGNDILKNAIRKTREYIVEGSNISLGMAASGFFPNMVITMVEAGEGSGSLSEVLEKTTEYYERKVDSTITTVLAVLEPIMIVMVSSIVLAIVLALYLPIFTMSRVIR